MLRANITTQRAVSWINIWKVNIAENERSTTKFEDCTNSTCVLIVNVNAHKKNLYKYWFRAPTLQTNYYANDDPISNIHSNRLFSFLYLLKIKFSKLKLCLRIKIESFYILHLKMGVFQICRCFPMVERDIFFAICFLNFKLKCQ